MRKFMETCIVEGNISVKAVLLGKKRKVHKILVDAKRRIRILLLFCIKQKKLKWISPM